MRAIHSMGLVALGLLFLGTSCVFGVIGEVRSKCVEAAGYEAEISDVTKKDALYQLSQIQNKLKVQGAVTSQFSKLESDNVKTNMASQRSITLGVMSLLNSDLKNVSAPTNGIMELQHSNEFYKTLMDNAGNDYKELQAVLSRRAQAIKNYEMFLADPVNRWYVGFGHYPQLDLKTEKVWQIVTSDVNETSRTGIADPVNPLGPNHEVRQ